MGPSNLSSGSLTHFSSQFQAFTGFPQTLHFPILDFLLLAVGFLTVLSVLYHALFGISADGFSFFGFSFVLYQISVAIVFYYFEGNLTSKKGNWLVSWDFYRKAGTHEGTSRMDVLQGLVPAILRTPERTSLVKTITRWGWSRMRYFFYFMVGTSHTKGPHKRTSTIWRNKSPRQVPSI